MNINLIDDTLLFSFSVAIKALFHRTIFPCFYSEGHGVGGQEEECSSKSNKSLNEMTVLFGRQSVITSLYHQLLL